MEYQLNDVDSLQRLRSDPTLKNSIRRIKLSTDNVLHAEMVEQKLNKYYFACGCQAGTIAVYLAMLSYFLIWWSSDFTLTISWWKIAVTLIVAALTGKLAGLLISKYRLEKMFRTLEKLLPQQ